MNQVDGVSDVELPFYGLCEGELRKGAMAAVGSLEFCPEESNSPTLALMPLQFLSVGHWCPPSCWPRAGAQREQVCTSPKSVGGPLVRDA